MSKDVGDGQDHPKGSTWFANYSLGELRDLQLHDNVMGKMLYRVESDYEPAARELFICSEAIKHFWLNQPQLVVHKGLLHYTWESKTGPLQLLMMPDYLVKQVLENHHTSKLGWSL